MVKSTSILVIGIGPDLVTLSAADFSAYSLYYPNCRLETVEYVPELLELVSAGFDIVHVLCRISTEGVIVDKEATITSGSNLLDRAYRHGSKVLFIAGENSKEAYINGIKLGERKINLVMTLNRHGGDFAAFLKKLLARMAAGEPMVRAWAAIAPQIRGASEANLPDCIFAAGLPNAVFLP